MARPERQEWDLLAPGARLSVLGLAVLRTAPFGLLPALLWGLVGIVGGRADVPVRVLLALGVAGIALAGAVGLVRTAQEIRRSRRRMGDPMYRAELLRFEIDSREAPDRAG